ncbi:MAG: UDP-glucose/GDP-mannose dehydrogenase family protein [Magnetospirillum sp.]|nr:UDP-glucose/GDP-mannose dehydrogenase family protein [Magnetospirillum sp.]
MRVAVIGTGYVGLVTAAGLAAVGHRVTCVDTVAERVAAVAAGQTPIHEPGLPPLVASTVAGGRLGATGDLAAAVAAAELTLIAVGTPEANGAIDLAAVTAAAAAVGAALRGRNDFPVVAVKSTVVPGTTAGRVREELESASGLAAGEGFGLAANPEFLSQGSAVADVLAPDRIVVGQWDRHSGDVLQDLYAPFPAPLLRMAVAEAEMVKYAANALQATLISFANEIAGLCEAVPGIDQRAVMAAVHAARMLDGGDGKRAGATAFLNGGIGFGGSCFPKDLAALAHWARGLGCPVPLVDAVRAVNAARPGRVAALLADALGGLEGRRVAVLGLAFKPATDDLRASPGLALAHHLAAQGAEVVVHDPLPSVRSRPLALAVAETAETALAGADAAVIATAWPEYRGWAWPALAGLMRRPLLVDGRGLLAGLSLPPPLRVLPIGRYPVPVPSQEELS